MAERHIVQNQNVIDETGRGFLEQRCDPDKWPMLIEVCKVIQRAVDNKDVSSKTMRQLAEELVIAIKATRSPEQYTQGAAFNFANDFNISHKIQNTLSMRRRFARSI